jgi:retinol dehydrogenase-13
MGDNQVVIVTGASGAIGKAIARQIAGNTKYGVVLVCRNPQKADNAQKEIIKATGNSNVRVEIVDLSRRQSIKELSTRWKGPLHILINNAATTPRRRLETPDGIELQFATNVMGYVWMINDFLDILKNSGPARIVNVASYWAGDMDLNDLEFKKRNYNNNTAYRQSKQANRMLTVAYANKLKKYHIAANACHPGDVNSQLSNGLGFGGHETPDDGARTPVWLATNDIGFEKTGRYFEHLKESSCQFSKDQNSIEKLFNICKTYI